MNLLGVPWVSQVLSLAHGSVRLGEGSGPKPPKTLWNIITNRIILALLVALLRSRVALSSQIFFWYLSCTILTTKSCMWRALSQKEGSSQKKLEGKNLG
jgi:hypothetical protein